ncbi:MAG: LysR family transcriptional regulator, partial [Alphaproteobacteria bacterium]
RVRRALGSTHGVASAVSDVYERELPGVVAAIAAEHPALRIEIVALPRIFNLTRREADLAITVSRPQSGRLVAEKLADYRLHLVASRSYLAAHPPIRSVAELRGHRILGYIPDMIFDPELDYLGVTGREGAPDLASNSVSVQMNLARAGAGLVIAHDFALPFFPELVRVLPGEIALMRTFHLVRHRDERPTGRIARIARLLSARLAAELARLEAAA